MQHDEVRTNAHHEPRRLDLQRETSGKASQKAGQQLGRQMEDAFTPGLDCIQEGIEEGEEKGDASRGSQEVEECQVPNCGCRGKQPNTQEEWNVAVAKARIDRDIEAAEQLALRTGRSQEPEDAIPKCQCLRGCTHRPARGTGSCAQATVKHQYAGNASATKTLTYAIGASTRM